MAGDATAAGKALWTLLPESQKTFQTEEGERGEHHPDEVLHRMLLSPRKDWRTLAQKAMSEAVALVEDLKQAWRLSEYDA